MQGEKAHDRRTWIRILSASAFVLSYLAARIAAGSARLGLSTQLTLAVLAGGAFAWFMFMEVQALRQCDELQKRIQLEALALAFPLTLLLLMMLGQLERIVELTRQDLGYRDVWGITAFFYILGLVMARRRYS